jgi:hypothetical protein
MFQVRHNNPILIYVGVGLGHRAVMSGAVGSSVVGAVRVLSFIYYFSIKEARRIVIRGIRSANHATPSTL